MRLFSELRRRRVFRTAALYIIGTWLVLQVADVVFPAMDIPERAIRYLLAAALAGFPAALIFGWFYDVGAYGIRRTGPAEEGELDAARPLRRSDYLILAAFAVVAAVILYGAIGNVIESPREVQVVSDNQKVQIERTARREGPPMVAVLPFTSISLEGDSEFFAVGVHDDLLTQLSKLQSMRVISRTSVLEYRDAERNIREIGKALSADAILEGGVQSAGGRIRINAQLIDARSDEHLWAETYDRKLSAANLFDVQAEIAKAIASALSAALTEHDSMQLTAIPTENMAAYRAYHQAMALWSRTNAGWDDPAYLGYLEEAVAQDPYFSRAWAEIAGTLAFRSFRANDPELTQRAEAALQSLQELASGSADYLFAQASYLYYVLEDYDRAHQVISKALELNPSNVRTVELKSWIERRQGDFAANLESKRLMQRLDPRDSRWTLLLVWGLIDLHRYEEAAAEIAKSSIEPSELATARILMEVRKHRNLGRAHNDFEELRRDNPARVPDGHLWQARVMGRDYPAAFEMVGELVPGGRILSHSERRHIYTYWLLDDKTAVAESLRRIRAQLQQARNDDGEFDDSSTYLKLALVEAADGNVQEAEQLVRRWERWVPIDWAGRMIGRSDACAILGMISATDAAVHCLRDGFKEPSFVIPFIDPYLPVYDSIREQTVFKELLAEIDAEYPVTMDN